MGTEGIEEMVRQCFDDVPYVDICGIEVLPFSQQFAYKELERIKSAFTVDFINVELDLAMEKLIKCIGFLALDIVMPALRVCMQMEASVVQYDAPAASFSHLVVLVQPAPGSEEPPEGPQAGWTPDVARPNDTNLNLFLSRRLGKATAQEISASLLELAPGYDIWDRGLYGRSENFFRFFRTKKDQPLIRKAFLDLIRETAEMLIGARKSQSQSFKADGTVFEFSDFRNLIMEDFISESTRILLERLMNASSRLQLNYSSTVWGKLEEVLPLSQGFDRGHRELVAKLLMKTVSERVADFLDEAMARINRERARRERDPADLESDLSDTDSESVSEFSVFIPQLPEDDYSSSSIGSGSIRVSSSRTGSCSIFSGCSTSTWYLSSLSSVRTRVSLCPSTTSEETVANITKNSNEDSANVKSPVAEKKQWRKRMFSICWRSKRRVAPLPVQAKPEESSVATERTRRLSARSCLASVFSRLLCCCKGQD